jgi:RNA polymerase sigma-70 factor (ECF subfamily)
MPDEANPRSTDAPPVVAIDDETLLERAAMGNRDAFELLYDRYAPRMFGLLIRIVRSRADAEDALQAAALDLWNRADRYDRSLGSAQTWILMIARARAIDSLRRTPRHAASDTAVVDTLAQRPEPSPTPPSAPIHHAMSELPEDQRAAIEMAFYRGLTREEIATALGVPVGTIKTRIRTGVRRLAESLASERKTA